MRRRLRFSSTDDIVGPWKASSLLGDGYCRGIVPRSQSKSPASAPCAAQVVTRTATNISAAASRCARSATTRARSSSISSWNSSMPTGPFTSRSSAANRSSGFESSTKSCPRLAKRGIYSQVVTSAVRTIPIEWASIPRLQMVVSIDGLQPEHDERRKPATYDRILKHIDGHQITVHCTVTRQLVQRDGYIDQFVDFWSANPNVRQLWVSLYTPQVGEESPERLQPEDRERVVAALDGAADPLSEVEDAEGHDSGLQRAAARVRTTASSRRRRPAFPLISSGRFRPASSAARPTAPTAGASPRPAWGRWAVTGCRAAFASAPFSSTLCAWDGRCAS